MDQAKEAVPGYGRNAYLIGAIDESSASDIGPICFGQIEILLQRKPSCGTGPGKNGIMPGDTHF